MSGPKLAVMTASSQRSAADERPRGRRLLPRPGQDVPHQDERQNRHADLGVDGEPVVGEAATAQVADGFGSEADRPASSRTPGRASSQ